MTKKCRQGVATCFVVGDALATLFFAIGDAFGHGDVPEAIVTKLLERGFDAV